MPSKCDINQLVWTVIEYIMLLPDYVHTQSHRPLMIKDKHVCEIIYYSNSGVNQREVFQSFLTLLLPILPLRIKPFSRKEACDICTLLPQSAHKSRGSQENLVWWHQRKGAMLLHWHDKGSSMLDKWYTNIRIITDSFL